VLEGALTEAYANGVDMAGLAVVDPHAHYYAAYGPAAFLDAARDNLSRAAALVEAGGPPSPPLPTLALVLLDIRAGHCFVDWRDGGVPVAGWTRHTLPDDPAAVRFADAAGHGVTLIAGRQLVSAEGLEVVVIGTTEAIADGLPVRDYLVSYASSLPVMLPWGVGKWLGRRGRLVCDLLDGAGLPPFMLGDNAGRPWIWRGTAQFSRAVPRGIRILPGSDPLPIRRHADRVGRSGCMLPVDLSGPRPSQALVNALLAPGTPMRRFGRQSSIGEFVWDQLVLRLDRVA
jgi:hypothetical protein